MKAKRLDTITTFSWQTRLTVFVGVFGIIWLFTDPLTSITTNTYILESLGGWAYFLLIVLAVSITVGIEYFRAFRLRSQKIYIQLIMILTEDGTRHLIEVPQDLRVEIFINLFLGYITKFAHPDTTRGRTDHYEWRLLVKVKNGNSDNKKMSKRDYVFVSNDDTIVEAGLANGDICKLRGKIKEEYTEKNLKELGF